MAATAPFERIDQYEAWLRSYVRLAETGRKLATSLAEAARRHGSRINQQRFSGHAQRLYNEEVHWTLQVEGVAALAATQRAQAPAEPPPPAAKKKAAKKTPARARS
jgi:pyruvate/2-oxoglutarate dehydrogenase complex dihydrolipoamide acyltransferase (E2) component